MADWYDDRDRDRNRWRRDANRSRDEEWDYRGYPSGGRMRDYDRDYEASSGRGFDYGRFYNSGYGRGYYDYDRDYGSAGRGRWEQDYDPDYEMNYRRGQYNYDNERDYGYNRGRSSPGRYGQGNYGRGMSDRSGRQTGYGGGQYGYGSYGRSQYGGYGSGFGVEDYESFSDYDEDFDRDYEEEPAYFTYTEYWVIPGPYSGMGPQGYQRSDERIFEEVCERLTRHGRLDASDVEVEVRGGEVFLRGQVDTRQAKRMAEDTVESIGGVKEVHNDLRVRKGMEQRGEQPGGEERRQGQQHVDLENTPPVNMDRQEPIEAEKRVMDGGIQNSA